jgi:hypothetical protein
MAAIVINPNPNPVNLDRQILILQNAFSPLEWLEYAFGRAWKAYRASRKNEICYPNIYRGNGEYREVMPDDKLKSYCFFVPADGMKPYSYIAIPRTSKNSYSELLNIVFYYNFNKIDSSRKYPFTDNLMQDVLEILRSVNNFKIENIYYDVKNVFEGYSFDAVSTQYLAYPFGGFRISGTLTFDEDLKNC